MPRSSARQPSRRRKEQKLTPAVCRECGSFLSSARERKLRRCSDCPAAYDEQLFETLRGWRSEVSQANSVPAFVVFTDSTLMAIAEDKPGTLQELGRISGVGKSKLERYGQAVLDLVNQAESRRPVP